jgi:DNA anti-recombination protein RmuC
MDELIRLMKDETRRIERKFEKLFEDLRQQQQEILEALERLERDKTALLRAVERLEKVQEENNRELLAIRQILRHT